MSSPASMFKELGAPLKNTRWSWGSVRESDRTVFLRVWQDGTRKVDGQRLIHLADKDEDEESQGAQERLQHIELIRGGYRCYLVMCQAQDTSANPRAVRSFNAREVFTGGELVELDEGYWLEFGERVDARSVAT